MSSPLMLHRRRRLSLIMLSILIAGGWVLVAVVDPDAGGPWEEMAIGTLFGTMFAQATLAAAWTAFGPLPLSWRLPLALAWLVGTTFAFAVYMLLHAPPGEVEIVIIFGAILLAQWGLAQGPLWSLRLWKGLYVRHVADGDAAPRPSDQQFGIRQLMILTALVAVPLGAGRAILPAIGWTTTQNNAEFQPIWIFLVVCNVLLALPLVIAPLLPRKPILATVLGLAFAVLVTVIEVPVGMLLSPNPGGVDWIVFLIMNGLHAAWVVAVLALLRRGGYRLGSAAATTLLPNSKA